MSKQFRNKKVAGGQKMKTKEAIPIKSKATLPIPSSNAPTEESAIDVMDQIRCRAYELYEQRGREDGYDIEDWLHAESEVIHRADTKAA
jgi:Protein of unknown function (DUF2934)